MSDRVTYFISDLHLDSSREKTTELFLQFLQFLQEQAVHADALYILGDLFEFWVGDDWVTDYNTLIQQSLRRVAEQGVPVYVMRGNRDFGLGWRFARRSGVKMLNDPTRIDLYGKPVLLMHGDSLCTLDRAHQRARRFFTCRPLMNCLYLVPLRFRLKFAHKARNDSQKRHHTLNDQIMDVTPEAVRAVMKKYQVPLLIHGHTHKPAIYPERVVLGPWWDKSAQILRYESTGEYELMDLVTTCRDNAPVT